MDHRKDRIGPVLMPAPADSGGCCPNIHRTSTGRKGLSLLIETHFRWIQWLFGTQKLYFRGYAFAEWRWLRSIPQIILFLLNIHHIHRIAISTNVYRVETPVDVCFQQPPNIHHIHRFYPASALCGPSPMAAAGPFSPFNRYTNPRRQR